MCFHVWYLGSCHYDIVCFSIGGTKCGRFPDTPARKRHHDIAFIFFTCPRCQVFQNFTLKCPDLFPSGQFYCKSKCPQKKKKQLDGNPSYADILRIDVEINTVVITLLSHRETSVYRRFTPPPKTASFFLPRNRPGSASLVTKFKQSGRCICADYGSPYYSPRLPAGAKRGWRRDRNASAKPRRCSSRAGNRETVQAWEQLDLLPVAPSWGTVSRTREAVCFQKNKKTKIAVHDNMLNGYFLS